MYHDLRELLEIFSRTVDYYIRSGLGDLLIYGIFEKTGDGLQHLEVGLLEIDIYHVKQQKKYHWQDDGFGKL
jgi:hypothetical protein